MPHSTVDIKAHFTEILIFLEVKPYFWLSCEWNYHRCHYFP